MTALALAGALAASTLPVPVGTAERAIRRHYAPRGEVTVTHCRERRRMTVCRVSPFYEDSTLRPPTWTVHVVRRGNRIEVYR